jgi:hypothetical protein
LWQKDYSFVKRARPDIQQAILVLCTRVRDPNQADWEKLMRAMKYLNGTREEILTLGADKLQVVKWYMDASFAVHQDFKSHTGAMMTLGKGAVQSIGRKQKMNVRNSTEHSHNDSVDKVHFAKKAGHCDIS